MRRSRVSLALSVHLLGWVGTLPAIQTPHTPSALLARAVARSGGDSALRSVRTARYEYLTQWMRTSFASLPAPAASGVELNTDWRDYQREVWRYDRRFLGSPAVIRNVVRDSVALTDTGQGWGPLSGAYVHERDEVFLAAPERLLLRMHDAALAGTVRRGADTVIGMAAHARLQATLDGREVTLFLRESDAQLTGVRYRAAQPWDFGLAAWGEMEVETWYSRWTVSGPFLVPYDYAINRVGRPYKRLSMVRIQLNAPLAEDSLAVPDALRARYLAEQRRAMFDLPVDSIGVDPDGFARFGVPGTPLGALRGREGWLLLGAGAAPLIADRAVARLRQSGAPILAAVLGTLTVGGAGGAPLLARAGIPLLASTTARPFLEVMFAQQGLEPRGITWITRGGWRVVAGDSLWLEPADLPDAEGGLLLWDPARRWLYAGDAPGPPQIRGALTIAAERGWPVTMMLVRGSAMPLAEVKRLAGLP